MACENIQNKRCRSSNFTPDERNILVRVTEKYEDIIESKKNDRESVLRKEEAWRKVTEEFNGLSNSESFRTKASLKTCYENLKKKVKKGTRKDNEDAVFDFVAVVPKSESEVSHDFLSTSDVDIPDMEMRRLRYESIEPKKKESSPKGLKRRRLNNYKTFKQRCISRDKNIMKLKIKLLERELQIKNFELKKLKTVSDLEIRTLQAKLKFYETKCQLLTSDKCKLDLPV